MSKIGIKQLADEDRPREKLLRLGAEALTKSELLAILVGSGSDEENAVSLMQRILHDSGGSLTALGSKSVADLTGYKGIGPAKAVTIKAACQIGKLMQAERVGRREPMDDPAKVRDYFAPKFIGKDSEEVWLLLLDTRLQLIAERQISKGGLTAATVDIRLLMREAILAGATSMILVHNHPTGNALPSRPDDALTKRVADAGRLMSITLQDHVIVGSGGEFYSYRAKRRL